MMEETLESDAIHNLSVTLTQVTGEIADINRNFQQLQNNKEKILLNINNNIDKIIQSIEKKRLELISTAEALSNKKKARETDRKKVKNENRNKTLGLK